VSVCPDLEDDQLHIRKSIEKFKSDHHELEVVQYTKPGNLICRSCVFLVNYSKFICVVPLKIVTEIIIKCNKIPT